MRVYINENFYDTSKEISEFCNDFLDYIISESKISFENIKKIESDAAAFIDSLDESQSDDVLYNYINDKINDIFKAIHVVSGKLVIAKYGSKKNVIKKFPTIHNLLLSHLYILLRYDPYNKQKEYGTFNSAINVLSLFLKVDIASIMSMRDIDYDIYYYNVLNSIRRTFIHEMRHAYDNMQSKGFFISDKSSEKYYDYKFEKETFGIFNREMEELYYILPHEYWARFASFVGLKQHYLSIEKDFDKIYNMLKRDDNVQFYKLPDDSKRKIINKLYAINQKGLRLTYLKKYKEIMDSYHVTYIDQDTNLKSLPIKEIYADLKKKLDNFKYFNKQDIEKIKDDIISLRWFFEKKKNQ